MREIVVRSPAAKCRVAPLLIGPEWWPSFHPHIGHGLGAASLLAEIFAENKPLQVRATRLLRSARRHQPLAHDTIAPRVARPQDAIDVPMLTQLIAPLGQEVNRRGRFLDFLIALCSSGVHRTRARALHEGGRAGAEHAWRPRERCTCTVREHMYCTCTAGGRAAPGAPDLAMPCTARALCTHALCCPCSTIPPVLGNPQAALFTWATRAR